MHVSIKIIIAIMLSGLFTVPVLAAEPDWYAGAGVGMSRLDITHADWDDGSLTGGSVDELGFTYKVFTGYRFNPYLGMEISYQSLGFSSFEGQSSGNVPSVWKSGQVGGETEGRGLSVEAVGAWTYRRLKLLAKGGLLFWDSTVSYEPTIAATSVVDDPQQSNRSVVHDDGVSLIYGIAAELRVYKNWWLRADVQQTTLGLVKTDDYSVNVLSLGVLVAF